VVLDRKMGSRKVSIEPGDWMVMYTDGLSESFNAARVPLQERGIHKLLSRPFASAQAVINTLQQGEIRHRGQTDPHDDLTLLVFGCQ
jgi:serine phosphatase RsbU (regulator of sigma subunit)